MTEDFPNQPLSPRRKARLGPLLLTGALAFGLGGAAVVGLGLANGVNLLGWPPHLSAPGTPAAPPSAPAPLAAPRTPDALENRVGLLESRLDRLDLEAAAVEGNTARAEALLVAFAARRVIARGAPLGYLEDQLKLRFGNAQPNAVATVIAAARSPVTLDRLAAQLETMAPRLARAPADESVWARVQRNIATLFVFRHEGASPSPDPALRLDHARLALHEGRIGDAIADVQRLPGSAAAQGWIDSAQRYSETDRALDLIEATALLAPQALRDGTGAPVNPAGALGAPVTSPAAPLPAKAPAAAPAPAASPASAPAPRH